jgi:hypothetical protein
VSINSGIGKCCAPQVLRTASASLAGQVGGGRGGGMEAFRINGERLWQSLMEMARIGATPRGGV